MVREYRLIIINKLEVYSIINNKIYFVYKIDYILKSFERGIRGKLFQKFSPN